MLRRVLVGGPRLQLLQQTRRINQAPVAPLLKAHAKAAKPSVAVSFNSRTRCILTVLNTQTVQASNKTVLNYWKSAALAAGACAVVGLLDEQQPATCASDKGNNEDPVEQAKKKVQELSAIAIAQLAALLPEDYSNFQKKVDEFLASGKGGQISWGFCMGGCAGFALKKVSKLGAVAIGTLFVLLQCASYSGYVDVNYKKLEGDVRNYLDVNKDGVFDTKDLDSMYKSIMKVLEFSLPAGSGFAAGFVLGFRSG
ncbi:putative mitochondrial protein [Phytophthora megakarya]|uniref:Putative mitochondrial protein n=1 Tax=Phytophthora megakarya TaxID=4795 RepID=A0A225VR79_9STRA|nr:putative mitochondrial protein [Phytophthora megakarya]